MPHITVPKGVPEIRGPMTCRPETATPLNELVDVPRGRDGDSPARPGERQPPPRRHRARDRRPVAERPQLHTARYTKVDVSLVRSFAMTDRTRLQVCAGGFKVANRANCGLPVDDLNSANLGRVLSAGSPCLLPFAARLVF